MKGWRYLALLWIEILVCLGAAFILALFGLALSAHWLLIGVRWGSWAPIEGYALTVYSIGTSLGILSILIMMKTRLGEIATRRSLQLLKIGLLLATIVAALFPGGMLPSDRFEGAFDAWQELFIAILPCVCFLHFAYLGRKYFF